MRRAGPSLVLLLFGLAFVLPILATGDRWGIWDWDHHLAFAEFERAALLEHGALPLWNPYVAGGTVGLQHPLSSFLCPDFVVVLLLGVPFGLKVLLALRLAAGLAGAFLLGRALGMPPVAATLTALVLNGSGAYSAHVAFGHFEWTLLGYVPWILLGFRRLLFEGSLASGAGAALGIAVLYLGGAPYLVFALGLVLVSSTLVWTVRRRSVGIGLLACAVLLLAGLLASVKLVPSAEFFQEHPRRRPPMVSIRHDQPAEGLLEIPKSLGRIFLGRAFAYDIPRELLKHSEYRRLRERGSASPELTRVRRKIVEEINYHAYVGLVPLLLVPFAFGLGRDRWLEWAGALGVLGILVLSDPFARAGWISPWEELRRLPLLGSFRTAGRFLAILTVPLSILSGLGLTALVSRFPRLGPIPASVAAFALVCGVALDLAYNGVSQLRRAFPFEPVPVQVRPFVMLGDPLDGFDLATVRAGVGALRGHSNLYYRTGAVAQDSPRYRGEAYLERGVGEARVLAVRPNEIQVEVRAERPTNLVVNQTYVPGWTRRDRDAPVGGVERRIVTPVGLEDSRVRLVYRPRTLTLGIALSSAALLVLYGVTVGKRLRRRH